ncbi:YeiH family protein [Chitinophaga sp. sic0106]|uniref:YeiH family protein n=1 Tax=Chitinophaga sp. sic0106 TaxID=2854785 RepID=UPI001C48062F|nr:putative sulfate exporter family transporter [Chitinophaga sp. sic0106]MBV7529904.1 putative sulfate exporter family transporter [Chitinophaga sp. sic0106]
MPELASVTAVSEEMAPKKSVLFSLTEDWWATIVGGLILLTVLVIGITNPDLKFTTPKLQWKDGETLTQNVFTASNFMLIGGIGIVYLVLSSVATYYQGASFKKYLPGFLVIFVLAVCSLVIAGNATLNYYGLEYVIFALIIGLLLGNVGHPPAWLREAARSEFFIKTGLVILGSSILFENIVDAGLPGLLQAVVVVAAVWFFSMWLSRKLKVDDEFGVILASAVSICGVSAAIVASGAIQGDKRKLSYVTTLVLLVAIPMMVLQPWIVKIFDIPAVVGGAWLGGTLDTTASVAAAAQMVGPEAVTTGVIIKFSQNVLIGVAAFFIAIWWSYRSKNENPGGQNPGLKVVWERFPKFVLGFIAASLIFSFAISTGTVKQTSGVFNSLRTVWFALAFVSIGIEARFSDLMTMEGGRPALAFIGAQVFNILWTLLWAFILFGYLFK